MARKTAAELRLEQAKKAAQDRRERMEHNRWQTPENVGHDYDAYLDQLEGEVADAQRELADAEHEEAGERFGPLPAADHEIDPAAPSAAEAYGPGTEEKAEEPKTSGWQEWGMRDFGGEGLMDELTRYAIEGVVNQDRFRSEAKGPEAPAPSVGGSAWTGSEAPSPSQGSGGLQGQDSLPANTAALRDRLNAPEAGRELGNTESLRARLDPPAREAESPEPDRDKGVER